MKSFIKSQKQYANEQIPSINWMDNRWDVSSWLPTRDIHKYIDFSSIKSKLNPDVKIDQPVSAEYTNFMKSICVYLYRKRRTGYMSIRNYINELRRMYSLVMSPRNETDPLLLTKWHFERLLQTRKEENYKNLYDSAANIKLIADTLDNLCLFKMKIDFEHGLKLNNQYNSLRKRSPKDDKKRNEDKIPSFEFFQAYAYCTNNPINDNEEILLRTIDLLIALGQRGNEITVIPYDCLVEKYNYSDSGEIIKDGHGNPIMTYGIKYFGEKNFDSKIHYLSDIDWPFAKRAIDRLKILTQEAREIAEFQENNPDRLWNIDPNSIITDDELFEILNFSSVKNLQYFLDRNGVKSVFEDQNPNRLHTASGRRVTKRLHYSAESIEQLLFKNKPNHFDFRVMNGSKPETVLKTSEILSIRFDGAFQFKKRGAHLKKTFPHRTKLKELNGAIGASIESESIFERRNLTEKDGSKLMATSHCFRHWRNTIYQLTGMTDVQQALALGRNDISQNKYYQHETLKEKTENHRNFLRFSNSQEKTNYLQDGIKNGTIKGSITDLYKKIRKEQSSTDADEFLCTHASSLHITPFGGCTHDFSQNPCLKHLQCWNGCSHLHRIGTESETTRLKDLLANLEKLKSKQDEELLAGSVWESDLNSKIINLKKALNEKVPNNQEKPVQVFPGSRYMLNLGKDRTSSVKDESK